MSNRNCESSAGADFLGEDVVDGEVVADEEEVGELDVLLPQQALPPRDLPHLGQNLKPGKNYQLLRLGIVCLIHSHHDHRHDGPAQRRRAWPPR